ncbi:MAG: SUMF1/EgtB/PvdO family nonheme iron enzyme [Bacteroidales bacterium]
MKKIALFISFALVFTQVLNAQKLTDVFPDFNQISLPLLTYKVGDQTFSSSDNNGIVEITVTPVEYGFGKKCSIEFKNVTGDTITLHNIVPFGASDEHVYITGKGNHGLSRTYLFRPGFSPVNVIVPDNAWELGFSAVESSANVGKNLAALTRRDSKTINNGSRSRFETFLNPGGSVKYNLWIDDYSGAWQEGLRLMFQERYLYDVEPGKFDDTMLKRKDLQWLRSCFAMNQMMAWDERFYDYTTKSYNVSPYLEKINELMGGYEAYGIWATWPALGMDQRNQWDMYRDLPGGYSALRQVVDDCHSKGIKFFLSYNPWDESTRSDETKFEGMTATTKALDVDGFVLDCQGSSSEQLQSAADVVKKGVVMYSEGMAVPRDMQGIVSGRVHNALYYCPMLNLNKFIRPDFAIFRVAGENDEPIKREFNMSFFNGYGTEINSFSAGRFEWSDEQLRYWGKLLLIQRENKDAFTQFDYTPLVPTFRDSIYVNKWPCKGKTIYTVYNLLPQGFNGPLYEISEAPETHFVDIYSHQMLNPVKVNGKTFLPVSAESFDCYYLGTNNESTVTAVAQFGNHLKVSRNNDQLNVTADNGDKILLWAGDPSYAKKPVEFGTSHFNVRLLDLFPGYEGKFVIQLFDGAEIIDENVITIQPGSARLISKKQVTEKTGKAPEGMVVIPSGLFRCKDFRTGDSFIKYPEPLADSTLMKKFYMDKYPVTNKEYKEFLDASGYVPEDKTNFLKNWENDSYPEGMGDYPVVYVTLEDAQAYAKWAGKRLPTEIEWQYAAQTQEGNEWPWKQKTPVKRIEDAITGTLSVWKLEGIEPGRCNLGDGQLYQVGKYPKGKNPYGLYDLVGCVWQLTNDLYDNTTYKYIMVRGGSYFSPSSSFWYVQGGPHELSFRQYLIRVSPSFDRKSTVGFRCVKDSL